MSWKLTFVLSLISVSLMADVAPDHADSPNASRKDSRAVVAYSGMEEAIMGLVGDGAHSKLTKVLTQLHKSAGDHIAQFGTHHSEETFWNKFTGFLDDLIVLTRIRNSDLKDDAEAIDLIKKSYAKWQEPMISLMEARLQELDKLIEGIDKKDPFFTAINQTELRRRLKSPVTGTIASTTGTKPMEALKDWDKIKTWIAKGELGRVGGHIATIFKEMTNDQEKALTDGLKKLAFGETAIPATLAEIRKEANPDYEKQVFAYLLDKSMKLDEGATGLAADGEFDGKFVAERDAKNPYHDKMTLALKDCSKETDPKKCEADKKQALTELREGWDSEVVLRWAMNQAKTPEGKKHLADALKVFAVEGQDGSARLEFKRDNAVASADDEANILLGRPGTVYTVPVNPNGFAIEFDREKDADKIADLLMHNAGKLGAVSAVAKPTTLGEEQIVRFDSDNLSTLAAINKKTKPTDVAGSTPGLSGAIEPVVDPVGEVEEPTRADFRDVLASLDRQLADADKAIKKEEQSIAKNAAAIAKAEKEMETGFATRDEHAARKKQLAQRKATALAAGKVVGLLLRIPEALKQLTNSSTPTTTDTAAK